MTLNFANWSIHRDPPAGIHFVRVMSVPAASLETGIQATAEIVPSHYVSEQRIANAFALLGKSNTARLIIGLLPTLYNIKSGDLGEILATEWITAHSGIYTVPIKRLRWRDHRNMAMRGDDVIGIQQDGQTSRLRFLKSEAKSRARLNDGVLADAREVLDQYGGLPAPHALTFVASRLFEIGDSVLASAIDREQLDLNIPIDNVRHLTFTFSGNDPDRYLVNHVNNYNGRINQWAVGLHVNNQANFVGAVYNGVIANANNP